MSQQLCLQLHQLQCREWEVRDREAGTNPQEQLHEWDVEGWCDLGVLCTILIKLTVPCVLAADCGYCEKCRTWFYALAPEEISFLPRQQVSSFPIHQQQKQILSDVCSYHMSEQTWDLQSGWHPSVSPAGRALVWIVAQIFPLIHRRDIFSHLLHRTWGVLGCLRPAALLLSAAQVVEY